MKAIIIVEFDADDVMNSHCGDDLEMLEGTSLEGALLGEMGWIQESGVTVKEVMMEDAVEPNDADLGAKVRKNLL